MNETLIENEYNETGAVSCWIVLAGAEQFFALCEMSNSKQNDWVSLIINRFEEQVN